MPIQLTDPPQHPFPQTPQPQYARPAQVQPPMVYVYEKPGWEYKIIVKNEQELLSEQELNELGQSGWELVGVVGLPGNVQFYFKRVRK